MAARGLNNFLGGRLRLKMFETFLLNSITEKACTGIYTSSNVEFLNLKLFILGKLHSFIILYLYMRFMYVVNNDPCRG